MKLHCPSCSSLIPAGNVELGAGWAKCAACHDLFPLVGMLPGFYPSQGREGRPVERPGDARVMVSRSPDRLLIHVPPYGMRPATWALLGFACFWLAFTAFWTAGALGVFGDQPFQTGNILFVCFSIFFWLVGFGLLGAVVWANGGAKIAYINRKEMVIQSRCLLPTWLSVPFWLIDADTDVVLWSALRNTKFFVSTTDEILLRSHRVLWKRTRCVERERVRHARNYRPVCQSETATTFGAELVYEKGSFLLPVDSKEEEEWLIFEVNDYLRSLRPHVDLREELS